MLWKATGITQKLLSGSKDLSSSLPCSSDLRKDGLLGFRVEHIGVSVAKQCQGAVGIAERSCHDRDCY